ncbi:hypothetical protein CTI12_AA206020 [Artemisia annua]|uniref:Uncharacterized protein n=1 Tax=Artemisia annua TaxID=35608 RepID=A0A2U1P128_ARTAN|nr:hypothetical protein CTI12_AA206020 [Artemisia annua]
MTQMRDIQMCIEMVQNKKPIYVQNLHEPQPNVHRPFWGVSGLEKPGCSGSEPRDVSVRDWFQVSKTKNTRSDHVQYDEGSLFTKNQFMSNEYEPQRLLHPLVEQSSSRNKYGKAKLAYSVLHHPKDTKIKAPDSTNTDPIYGFQSYGDDLQAQTFGDTLFAFTWCLPPNIEGDTSGYSYDTNSLKLQEMVQPDTSGIRMCKMKVANDEPNGRLQPKRRRGTPTERTQKNVGNGETSGAYEYGISPHGSNQTEGGDVSVGQSFNICQTEHAIIDHMSCGQQELVAQNQFVSNKYGGKQKLCHMLDKGKSDSRFVGDDSPYSVLHNDQDTRINGGGSTNGDPICESCSPTKLPKRHKQKHSRCTNSDNHRVTLNPQEVSGLYIDVGDPDWACDKF